MAEFSSKNWRKMRDDVVYLPKPGQGDDMKECEPEQKHENRPYSKNGFFKERTGDRDRR